MSFQSLEINPATPLYELLYDAIKEKIDNGEYKSGQRIPSEEQLSEIYHVSRVTVRSALSRLVEDNILVKQHGKGTFVKMPEYIESVGVGGSFTRSCIQNHAIPGTEIIYKGKIKADKKLSSILSVEKGAAVICIKRLRSVDGTAVIFEEDYFNQIYDFLLEIKLDNESLLEVIRKHVGTVAQEFNDIFDVKPASTEQAKHLKCLIGDPLLRVCQTVLANDMKYMYYNEQFIRSDLYKYAIRSY